MAPSNELSSSGNLMKRKTETLPGMDRAKVRVATHAQAEREDREFWFSQTPLQRLRHLEQLRELNYGSEVLNQRLQRILTVLERQRR